jgi:DNA-binding transcriptional LysR family regulator
MDRVTAVALFARIVESGSFSKAAAEFGITQPTATKAVAAMGRAWARACCTAPRAA